MDLKTGIKEHARLGSNKAKPTARISQMSITKILMSQ